MTGKIGVAISTTGDSHRLGFLETCVESWLDALPLGSVLVVTVDGDEAAGARVASALDYQQGAIIRVGQPVPLAGFPAPGQPERVRDGRCGVAVNKNTGIEFLMSAGVEHLFLSDDDTWPRHPSALGVHIGMSKGPVRHSMICWGKGRFGGNKQTHDWWTWPRGVMLYAHRSVIEDIGGMDEAFGPGGHEHVEWSERIHAAGHTPDLFCSPGVPAGDFWHCEDMGRAGESRVALQKRRRATTSVRRVDGDWRRINAAWEARRARGIERVPYEARLNGRASATVCTTNPSGRGAGVDGGEK